MGFLLSHLLIHVITRPSVEMTLRHPRHTKKISTQITYLLIRQVTKNRENVYNETMLEQGYVPGAYRTVNNKKLCPKVTS